MAVLSAVLFGAVALPIAAVASASTLKSSAAVAVGAAGPGVLIAESVPEPALKACVLPVADLSPLCKDVNTVN
jgi:hypothetical protein